MVKYTHAYSAQGYAVLVDYHTSDVTPCPLAPKDVGMHSVIMDYIRDAEERDTTRVADELIMLRTAVALLHPHHLIYGGAVRPKGGGLMLAD